MTRPSVSTAIIQNPALPDDACIHCGNPVPARASSRFCCAGCETVYGWLQANRLGQYYEIKDRLGSPRGSTPDWESVDRFDDLDDPEIAAKYSWRSEDGLWMEFYLEGVHCAACVWLTEKLTDLVDHVRFARLNLGSSIATVQIDPDGSFAEVARGILKMGYRPHPVERGEESQGSNALLMKRENRLFLVRVGVAAACAGNIMLLAVSLYGGAEGPLAVRFRWLSFVLYLPVLLFSAVPFYQSAWNSLKTRQLSIDIPVVFGIGLGSFVSMVNLFSGDDRIYFDSLASLVFLLLSTRYVLKRTQQKALESSRMMQFLTPSFVRRWDEATQSYVEVRIERIQQGDRVQVRAGEPIPVDGVVTLGKSQIDGSLLTGESEPEQTWEGKVVFAGTTNLDAPLEIQVTQSGRDTRVGQILHSMDRLLTRKASVTLFADRVSRYFVGAVIVLSAAVFLWGLIAPGSIGWHEGLNRALAIAIVTCPCTFALITPLAFSMTLGKLAKCGVLLKGPDVLEKLASAHTIFLDKTGTLTFGRPQVLEWQVPKDLEPAVLAVEEQSNHLVARTLVRHLRKQGIAPTQQPLSSFQETLGQGVRARVGHDWVELRRAQAPGALGSEISVLKNGWAVGRIVLSDRVHPEARESVGRLQKMGLTPWILSGDHCASVQSAGLAVGIDRELCLFEASPEEKAATIQALAGSIMVGDGANDAMALAQASVGIAVHGGVELSMRAADVYLQRSGIQAICELITISRESIRVIQRNLAFSLIYNFVAAGFALAGKIDPLFAALLMPLSALTVFLSSVAGTARLRASFRRLRS